MLITYDFVFKTILFAIDLDFLFSIVVKHKVMI